ncbi:peptide ABC transporter permease [Marinomonas sp. UCMA 3892]|jgi:peptide/nickel transport system permease protein|uniref:ABC transporter permease n=1 Tax=Marinomonas sp. UCMA 3892 TaxID=1972585 RepID=UPI00146E71BF|nr:ABC transporter permease [Marinomonas sp. UCMA 3892]MBU1296517.1 ABC transporter permease [Gammaproteobacteria bacterium]MBU1467158.1 ABC transporter permease [Gammaproteobacteria bacterium]MBU2024030.1 ABC transporter permease [Gammaproteobacteria bacterium]MBU2240609.1 ABC transporter permease [Gammaproteobacteria bacterium]MBU2319103.1 ABC transporter permease [Gammaproteobacteria bacterium]
MLYDKIQLIIKRLMLAVPTLFGVLVISFCLTRALPGDPAVYFAGAMADEASIQQVREKLGLDRSLPYQFLAYCNNLLNGELGQSLTTGQSVTYEIKARLPASLELTLLGLFMGLLTAIPLGILAALKPNTWIDHLCRVLVTAGASTPIFFSGLFLMFVFYYLLGWSPSPIGRLDFIYLEPPHVTGFYTIDALIIGDYEVFKAAFAQLLLPASTLALCALAPIARMTRSSMITALESEYVKAAKANGISAKMRVYVYALQNASLPLLTVIGLVFGFLLGGNVLVEKVYSWPGIGSFAIDALVASDYAAIQGFVLIMAVLFVTLNLIIDILYTLFDPRMGRNE